MFDYIYVVNCFDRYYPSPWNIKFTTHDKDEAIEVMETIKSIPKMYGDPGHDAILDALKEKFNITVFGSYDYVEVNRLDFDSLKWEIDIA